MFDEEGAFEMVVRDHGSGMLATARRIMKNDHDAKDAVQDALIAVHESDGFSGGHLSAWLRRIVINRCLMRIRSQKRKREDSIELRPEPWIEPLDLEQEETRRMVRSQIDRLPESLRSALMLRDLEELSTKEAAARLG